MLKKFINKIHKYTGVLIRIDDVAENMNWSIMDKCESLFDKNNIKLYGYKAGTWGPTKCNDLFRNENTWRYPCKNLVNDGEICEL